MGVESEPGKHPAASLQGQEQLALRRLGISLLIVFACLLGCCGLLAGMVHNDTGLGELSRLPVIERWYSEHADSTEEFVIVLGDSLGRTAFNARYFNDARGTDLPQAWNLASSARTYPEMLLDIDRPALRNAQLILFVSPVTSFSPSKLSLNPRKANVYGLLGLPEALDDNISKFGSELDQQSFELLRRPRHQLLLDARWRLPEYAKDSLLVSFGSQRDRHRYLLTDYNRDLQYPLFGNNLDRQARDAGVEARIAQLQSGSYCGIDNPQCRQALADVVRGLADNSGGLLVVMYPLQAQYRDWLQQSYPHYDATWLQELLGPDIDILDLTTYETEGLFRDDLHIADDASTGLTERIMQHLLTGSGVQD